MRHLLPILWLGLLVAAPNLRAGLLEETQQSQLANGLEVILIRHAANPVVAVTAVVRAGVRDEDAECQGASHFLEHLLFNGTKRRTQKQLYDEADFYGIYNNAATREDYTVFMMLAGREYLAQALDLQADMLFHSTIPPENFEKERKIVLEEIARGGHRREYLAEYFHRGRVFMDTPYALPVLGTPESLEKIGRDAVWNYYRQFYQPGNISLLVMGDFEPETALKLIEQEFGSIPKGEPPPASAVGSIRWQGAKMILKAEPALGQNHLDVSMPGPKPGQADFAPTAALARVLSDRLHARYVTGQENAVKQISLSLDFNRDFSWLRLSAQMDAKADAAGLARQILADLRQPGSYRAAAADLHGLVNDLAAQEVYLSEKVHYFTFERAGALVAGGLHSLKSTVAALEAVFPDQLPQAGERYLAHAPFIATLVGPGVESREIPDFEVGDKGRPLDAAWPPEASPILREVLPGGLTVLVQENRGSNIFAAHVLGRNRSAAEPRGREGVADFLHRMLVRGTAHRSAQEIRRELSEIGGTLKVTDDRFLAFDDYYFSGEYSYVRLETLERHGDRGLWLLADLIRYPRLDAGDIDDLKKKVLAELVGGAGNRRKAARETLLKALLGRHPLVNPIGGGSKSISPLRREDLVRFHQRYFSPRNLILSIVADRRPERVFPAVRQAFTDYSGVSPCRQAPKFGKPSSAQTIHLADTGSPQAQILLGHLATIAEAERPAAAMVESLLSNRMSFQLREREGLAYSIGCGFNFTLSGVYFIAEMGTRPQNLQAAQDGLQREIREFRLAEVNAEDLDRVRNNLISRRRMRRLTSINQAFSLGLQEYRGLPSDFEEQWVALLKKVTPGQVREAAQKFLRPDEGVVVIAP